MRYLSIFVLVFVMSQVCHAELPKDYSAKSASEKQEILWRQIVADPYAEPDLPKENPGFLAMAQLLFVSYLLPSFTHESDELPVGRSKLIHTYGSVAKVSLRPTGGSYTGLFRTGARGFARLSLAQQGGSFTPGMAMKLLVDGHPSVNLQVIYSLEGQLDDQNFFQHPFSNLIDPPKSGTGQFLAGAFHKAIMSLHPKTATETYLPVDHAASVEHDGTLVSNPLSPYQLIFEPTQESKGQMDSADPTDFRIKLAQIQAGMTLYRVRARAKGNTGPGEPIGELVLDSSFVASPYGDESLFFQHHVDR